MNENTREVFQESMALDEAVLGREREVGEVCVLRRHGADRGPATTWCASQAGMRWDFCCRDEPGDRQRAAAEILDAVLKQQSSHRECGGTAPFAERRRSRTQDRVSEVWRQLRSKLARLHRHHFCHDPDRVSGPHPAGACAAHVRRNRPRHRRRDRREETCSLRTAISR